MMRVRIAWTVCPATMSPTPRRYLSHWQFIAKKKKKKPLFFFLFKKMHKMKFWIPVDFYYYYFFFFGRLQISIFFFLRKPYRFLLVKNFKAQAEALSVIQIFNCLQIHPDKNISITEKGQFGKKKYQIIKKGEKKRKEFATSRCTNAASSH